MFRNHNQGNQDEGNANYTLLKRVTSHSVAKGKGRVWAAGPQGRGRSHGGLLGQPSPEQNWEPFRITSLSFCSPAITWHPIQLLIFKPRRNLWFYEKGSAKELKFMTCTRNYKEPACKGADKKNTTRGCTGHMLGFCTVLKGWPGPVGRHSTNRYKCDSVSFLQGKNLAMGAIAVTAAQHSFIKVHWKQGLQESRTCLVSDDTSPPDPTDSVLNVKSWRMTFCFG